MSELRTFIGPLTETQHILFSSIPIENELRELVPEQCRPCVNFAVLRLSQLAMSVASEELDSDSAKAEIRDRTTYCPGATVNPNLYDADPLCPTQKD